MTGGRTPRLAGFVSTGCGVAYLVDEYGHPWAKAYEMEGEMFCGYVDVSGVVVTREGSGWGEDAPCYEDFLREAAENAAEPLGSRLSGYGRRGVSQRDIRFAQCVPETRRGSLRDSCGEYDEEAIY